jgi:predicted amidohydrolase
MKKSIVLGVAQTGNSLDVSKNFDSIKYFLNIFKNEGVDLVVFPGCSLSGFSAKMKECTSKVLESYLLEIQEWSNENNIQVILPTALVEEEKIFNSGFWFKKNERQQFFKIGLTESEKQFFSVPEKPGEKVLNINGFRCGLLICKEAQEETWSYIDDEVDFIVWPGYWGWTQEFTWQEKDDGIDNLVYMNSTKWKCPIIQSNFAYNDLGQHTGAGPEGLSIVVDSENKVVFRAGHLKESGYVVKLEKSNGRISVEQCRHVGLTGSHLNAD